MGYFLLSRDTLLYPLPLLHTGRLYSLFLAQQGSWPLLTISRVLPPIKAPVGFPRVSVHIINGLFWFNVEPYITMVGEGLLIRHMPYFYRSTGACHAHCNVNDPPSSDVNKNKKNKNILLMFIQYKLFTHVPHTVYVPISIYYNWK